MKYNNIFAAPIIENQLKIDNKKIIKYITNFKKKNKGVVISNVGGWQSPNLNPNEDVFKDLRTNIVNQSIDYIKQCDFKHGKFTIASMWANMNLFQDFNSLHLHQRCIISGVYYLKTPKDCGNLVFKHPCSHLEYDWDSFNFYNHNEYNSPLYEFLPKEGQLILFPPWLEHHVKPNLNKKQDRLSISFNIRI